MIRRRNVLQAIAIAVAVCSAGQAAGAAQTHRRGACDYVTNDDVFRVLGWNVVSRERRPYDLHGGTGAMCFLASTQGQVVVILPDLGSDFPGISVYNDPNAAGLAKKLYGLGADVTLYNGTVYVARGHRNIAVRVVPDSHAASYAEVEDFAKVVIPRMASGLRP